MARRLVVLVGGEVVDRRARPRVIKRDEPLDVGAEAARDALAGARASRRRAVARRPRAGRLPVSMALRQLEHAILGYVAVLRRHAAASVGVSLWGAARGPRARGTACAGGALADANDGVELGLRIAALLGAAARIGVRELARAQRVPGRVVARHALIRPCAVCRLCACRARPKLGGVGEGRVRGRAVVRHVEAASRRHTDGWMHVALRDHEGA